MKLYSVSVTLDNDRVPLIVPCKGYADACQTAVKALSHEGVVEATAMIRYTKEVPPQPDDVS